MPSRRAGYDTRTTTATAGARRPARLRGWKVSLATWLDSGGHCANLRDTKFTETGVAFALNPGDGRDIYWVQIYADRD